MGHGAWSMEHGAESMGHGAWGLEQGAGEFVWCPVWINLETPRLVFAFYGLEGLWFSGIPFDQVLLFQLIDIGEGTKPEFHGHLMFLISHVFPFANGAKMKRDYLWNLERPG